MRPERKETTIYHNETLTRKKTVSKITNIKDEEIETICRGLELLQESQDKYSKLAAEMLDTLNGIRQKADSLEA